ncbi:MAG TPA: YDG domain-containing protein [Burkholderiaceae bacterium]
MKQASLNHVYRVIWSHVLRTWVVVAENVKGRGKSSSRKLVAAALALTAGLAQAGPGGGQVTSGAGSIAQSGNTTTINQSSQNLSINWQSFNVGSQETVNFLQPSASAIAVNRIAGNNGSVILGHINANGQVYLINPNGILFGEGAQVNVGGLVATTLDINDSTAAGNTRAFNGNGSGSVINQGTINAANGGYVALIGNHVANQGTITAQLGSVALGAGNAVTLSFNGNSLVHMQVDKSVLQSLAENGGLIQADGGQVIMTAGAKNSLLASVVNNTGVIEARTVENHNGTIELLGGMNAGTVNVGGTLDASAPNGGDGGAIETSAANVKVANGTIITTLAAHGKTGSWLVDPQDFTVAADGSGDITGATLSSELATTNATLQSSAGKNAGSGDININDTVSWSANTILTLTASNNVNFNANVTATGNTAGLVINPNTANGGEAASGTGTFNLAYGLGNEYYGNGISITLSGATPSLTIAGQVYTVINSLGNSYDTTMTPSSPSLQSIAASGNLSGHYALGSNIDGAPSQSWNNRQGFFPIGSSSSPFTGTLEGLGHEISNTGINMPTVDHLGLFGTIGTTGVVQNLQLIGAMVTGHYGIGGLAYDNQGTIKNVTAFTLVSGVDMVGGVVARNEGTIANVFAFGTVTERNSNGVYGVGGLLGSNYGGIVSNSASIGTVSGGDYVGGLVGMNFTGTVIGSHASGNVTGHNEVGGLVGENYSTLSNSYATGNVNSSGTFSGGLTGRNNNDTLSNSYATGNVVGAIDAGGLAGGNYGTIINTYAVGSVSGTTGVGGLVAGTKQNGTVTNSYWNTQTSGQSSSMGGTGLATAAMQTASNYAGFNFSTTPGATGNSWVMVDVDGGLNNAGGASGGTYPMLTSEYSTMVSNGHQLQLVAMALGANYSQTTRADMSGTRPGSGVSDVWMSTGFIPLGNTTANFTGTYYGNHFAVDGPAINLPNSAGDVGLFGVTGSAAVINDILLSGGNVIGSSINATSATGGLVGTNNGTIVNSYVSAGVTSGQNMIGVLAGRNTGTIDGSYVSGSAITYVFGTNGSAGHGVGGLAGANYGTISNSHTTATVSGNAEVGGLAGVNGDLASTKGTISGSSATGLVFGATDVGGLVGHNYYTVSNSYATGNVSGVFGSLIFSGGLAGTNDGAINASYATGSLTGTGGSSGDGGLVGLNRGMVNTSYASGAISGGQGVGGLVGMSNHGEVNSSYATGNVSGTGNVGGLVGVNYNGATIGDSYSTGNVTGNSNIGGLVGYNYGGSINASYSTGGVGGSINVGALVGSNNQGKVTYSFYDSANDGGRTGIGGQADVAGAVWGMSGADMQQQTNFTSATAANGNVNPGWDFVTGRVWNNSPTINGGAPYLCATASGCVVQAVTLYVDPIGGSSVYGAAAGATGYILDTSPVIGSGFVINDASPTGTALWSGAPLSSFNVGSYQIAYSGGLSVNNPSFTLAAGNAASWNVTPATLTIAGQTAANKVYNGTNVATLTGGTLVGLVNGDNVTLNSAGTFPSKDVGTGLGVTASDTLNGTAASNYVLVQPTGLTASITPLALTVSATGANRAYNGGLNDTVTLSSAGIVAGDVVNLADTSATFASKNAGTGVKVTVSGISLSGADAGNYTLVSTTATTSANITPATLTVTGETATNKVYNGNVSDTLSGGSLVGVIGGDSVTLTQAGSFGSKNVGTGLTVTAADSLGGTGAGNYTLVQPTGLVANVTPATLTVIGESAASRVYNGGTVATLTGGSLSGVVSGDNVTLNQTGSFASKNVGNGIVVTAADTLSGTDAGNYTVVQPSRLIANITPLAVTVVATGNNIVYNGTTSDTVTLTSSGVVAGDALSFTDSAATFANKNVGTNLAVNVIGINMSGVDAGNYTLTNRNATTSASIIPATLTVTGETAATKVYNGTTATTLSGGQLVGLVAGDHLTLTQTGSFASKNAGTGVAVNVNDLITGTGATNYTLVQPTSVVGNITPATITVTASGTSKVYDGTVNDTVKLSSSGIVTGDVVTISDSSATFAGKNVGTNLAVTVSGLSMSGADAGNYKLASQSASTSASITPAPLTVTGETAADKVYNGTTAATLNGGSLVGVLAGDSVTLNQAGSFASKNVGTNVAVTVADTLSGTAAANYKLVEPANVTASITPLSVTVTGETATNRVYNGTTVDPLTGGSLVGAIAGDAVTLVQTGTFASKDVGTGIAVTVADSLAGTSAGNYTLVQPTGTLHANITPLAITVAASGTNMVYNGTVNDTVKLAGTGVIAGDAVSFSDTSATFAGKNVGTGIRVSVSGISMTGTDAGNYTLGNTSATTSANITPAALTVTGESATTRTYNGTTAATLSGGVLSGLIAGDSVTLNQAGAFVSKNAGIGVAVTTADTISGTSASNYTLVQPSNVTGNITQAVLTVIGQRATNIVYNGSTLDPLTAGHLQGVLPGDVVTLISLGNFISPNIGIAIPVIVSDTLGGASAGNYILTQPTGLSANITKP